MKRFLLPLTLLSFAVILPVRADTPKVEKETAKPITVPFELLKTGHMAVMIKINGKGPYRVIFDTGAPVSLINNKVAKESGLLDNVKKPLFSLFNTAGQTSMKKLEIGDVMDHPTVEAISKALGPIEGIVGFPFFARYKTSINYQAKELTFVPNGFDPPDVMQELAASLMTMINEKQPKAKVLVPAAQWGMIAVKDSKDEDAGVVVKEVYADSAAAKAGLKPGDRILTLDGRWTDSLRDLYDAAGFVKPGSAVNVVILRDGKEKELMIKPISGL
jgi:membrane-associated protease RseP (regulator of RpoE activity)